MSVVSSASRPADSPDLPEKGAAVSPTSWTPAGEMGRREWQLEGRRLSAISKASPWWIGDWLAFGAEKWGETEQWGEKYSEAKKLTGYDGKTLRNRRYVSAAVPRELRVPDLTWSHHSLVAGLKDRQEQVEWLERATRERLSVDDLRIELRASERGRYRKRVSDKLPTQDISHVVTCPECGCQVTVSLNPGTVLGPQPSQVREQHSESAASAIATLAQG